MLNSPYQTKDYIMTTLTLSQKTDFTVSANKAHKLLASLKKYDQYKSSSVRDIAHFTKVSGSFDRNALNVFDISYSTILTNDEKDLHKIIQDEIDEKVYSQLSALEVLEDLQDLKEELFEFNVLHGVSKKLTYINKKKEHIKLLEAYLLKSKEHTSPLEKKIASLKKLKENIFEKNEDFVFEHQFWDKKALQETLKEIKSTILRYEDEISEINSTKKLTICLFESSKELLGL